jgi:hypothetical protein
MTVQPIGEVDARFSGEGAPPTSWDVAREQLETAEVYWLTTVRRDGRPHVTPLIAVWTTARCTSARVPTNRRRATSRRTCTAQ